MLLTIVLLCRRDHQALRGGTWFIGQRCHAVDEDLSFCHDSSLGNAVSAVTGCTLTLCPLDAVGMSSGGRLHGQTVDDHLDVVRYANCRMSTLEVRFRVAS